MRGIGIGAAAVLAVSVAACSMAGGVATPPNSSATAAVVAGATATLRATPTPVSPSAQPTSTLSPTDNDLAAEAARLVRIAAGTPGEALSVTHNLDVPAGLCRDQVQFPAWRVCWDQLGRLVWLENVEASTSPSGTLETKLEDSAMWQRGDALLAALGVKAGRVASGAPDLDRERWAWQSVIDGIPTASGNLDLTFAFDGSFIEFELRPVAVAPRPARLLSVEQAQVIAVPDGKQRAGATFITELEWWGGFDSPCKLAWVVQFRLAGSEYSAMQVVDAGSGAILDAGSVM